MEIKYLKTFVRGNKSRFDSKLIMIYSFRLQFFGSTGFEIKIYYIRHRGGSV